MRLRSERERRKLAAPGDGGNVSEFGGLMKGRGKAESSEAFKLSWQSEAGRSVSQAFSLFLRGCGHACLLNE